MGRTTIYCTYFASPCSVMLNFDFSWICFQKTASVPPVFTPFAVKPNNLSCGKGSWSGGWPENATVTLAELQRTSVQMGETHLGFMAAARRKTRGSPSGVCKNTPNGLSIWWKRLTSSQVPTSKHSDGTTLIAHHRQHDLVRKNVSQREKMV